MDMKLYEEIHQKSYCEKCGKEMKIGENKKYKENSILLCDKCLDKCLINKFFITSR